MLYAELYALTFWIARVLGLIEDTVMSYGFDSPEDGAPPEREKRRCAQKVGVTSPGKGRTARTPAGI